MRLFDLNTLGNYFLQLEEMLSHHLSFGDFSVLLSIFLIVSDDFLLLPTHFWEGDLSSRLYPTGLPNLVLMKVHVKMVHCYSNVFLISLCVCVCVCSSNNSSIFPDRWARAKGIHTPKSVSTKVRQLRRGYVSVAPTLSVIKERKNTRQTGCTQ